MCEDCEGKNLKRDLGDEGIKVLTGPRFGICGVFYCKNTLLLFFSLERHRKLYMEKAENSTYISWLWLQRLVGCLLWVLWSSFRRECLWEGAFPLFHLLRAARGTRTAFSFHNESVRRNYPVIYYSSTHILSFQSCSKQSTEVQALAGSRAARDPSGKSSC